MEQIGEFEKALSQVLSDAEKKWQIRDSTLAYFLLKQGLAYYFRAISTGEHKISTE